MASALDLLSAAALMSGNDGQQSTEPVAVEQQSDDTDSSKAPVQPGPIVVEHAPLGEADWARIQQALAAELDADKTDEDEPPLPDPAPASLKRRRDSSSNSTQGTERQRPVSSNVFHPILANTNHHPQPPLQLFTDSSGAATLAVSAPISSFPSSASNIISLPNPLSIAKPKPPPIIPPYAVPEDSGIIRCVCPYAADDGFTIQCDICNVWQHAACVGILPDSVPDEYGCEMCNPQGARERRVDPVRAEQGMRRRMELERLAGGAGMIRIGSFGSSPVKPGTPPPVSLPVVRPPVVEVRPPLAARNKSKKPNSNDSAPPQAYDQDANTTDGDSPKPSGYTTPGGLSKDAVGRRRRQAKQSGVGRSRGPPAVATPATTPGAMDRNPTGINGTGADDLHNEVSSVQVTPRLASLGSLRANLPQNTAPPDVSDEDDETAGEERYESWRYEYTQIEANLWRGAETIDRAQQILRVLEGISMAEDEPDFEQAEALHARQIGNRPKLTTQKTAASFVTSALDDPSCIVVNSLPSPLAISVKPLPSSAFFLHPPGSSAYVNTAAQAPICPYPRPSINALYAAQSIPSKTFIAPIRGQICTLDAYQRDPINQYASLGVPKQGVRFLPHPWSLAIDGRLFGNEVRFARSGCHPNAIIKAVRTQPSAASRRSDNIGDKDDLRSSKASSVWEEQRQGADLNSTIVFALYSTTEIDQREEIVLPWDWDDAHVVHSLPQLMAAPPLPDGVDWSDLEPLARNMANVATTLLGNGHCACDKKRDCALFWMCRVAGATAPLTRAQVNKCESFGSVLMTALGVNGNGGAPGSVTPGGKEDFASRSKARKAKKPEVGPLLGIERGWLLRKDRPPPEVIVSPDSPLSPVPMLSDDDEAMSEIASDDEPRDSESTGE